jgi:hypothetical protein
VSTAKVDKRHPNQQTLNFAIKNKWEKPPLCCALKKYFTCSVSTGTERNEARFITVMPKRRKIRLIEGNAKCQSSKTINL